MTAENIAILEKHIKHWHTLKVAGYVSHLDNQSKKEIEKVLREELQPGYYENLWCADCVIDMMKRIYGHYERHLAALEAQKQSQALAFAAASLTGDPAGGSKVSKGKKAPKK